MFIFPSLLSIHVVQAKIISKFVFLELCIATIIFCGAGMCSVCVVCITSANGSFAEFWIVALEPENKQHLTFFGLHNHAIDPQSNARKPRRPMQMPNVMFFHPALNWN